MAGLLNLSEAGALALHAMVCLAREPRRPTSAPKMAAAMRVSEAHLSKVLQRLSREGLVRSVRGPRGGFLLGRPAHTIALLEIYEAIEGPLPRSPCLFSREACGGPCILGGLLGQVAHQVRDYLAGQRLADLVEPGRPIPPIVLLPPAVGAGGVNRP